MKAQGWIVRGVVALLLSAGIAPVLAQADVVFPVSETFPFAPDTSTSSPAIRVSIPNGWLPEPNQTIALGVTVDGNPATATIVLVCPDGTTSASSCAPAADAASGNAVAKGWLRTSAYPGVCTNFDYPAPSSVGLATDFTLAGNQLTALDCGGMAVVQVTAGGATRKFIIPGDSNFNGIPDAWENQVRAALTPVAKTGTNADGSVTFTADSCMFGPSHVGKVIAATGLTTGASADARATILQVTSPTVVTATVTAGTFNANTKIPGGFWEISPTPYPTGQEDLDSPSTGFCGDGIAAADEYRGFVVAIADPAPGVVIDEAANRKHIRTDPRVKDVVVHLVNAQCQVSTGTDPLGYLGGGTKTYPTDGTSLFANLNTLVSGTQVRLLGYRPNATNFTTDQWVDNLLGLTVNVSLDATGKVTGATSQFSYTPAGTTSDRRINQNAIYPLSDSVTGNSIQKGLRLTECLHTVPASDLAANVSLPLGSAGVGTPNGPDNAILYTQRIINYINGLIDAGAGRRLKYFSYLNGAWVLQFTSAGAPTQADRDLIISKAMQYYLAMEIGHAMQLTPSFSTTYGYHVAPNTGDNLDQAIVQKIDSKAAGFNSFYIPSQYSTTDVASFKMKN